MWFKGTDMERKQDFDEEMDGVHLENQEDGRIMLR
jgi:hypothetical protein